MSEKKLKPCPFCGGGADYIQILGNYERPHEVYCLTCDGGITEGRSKDGVIHNWNNRPIEDALHARIAELEGFIGQLIEAGNELEAGLDEYWEELSTREVANWRRLVKEWKEREE